jgi:hypothetical protein
VRAWTDVNDMLAISALISWLLAELLGAFMLRNWVTSGAARLRKTRSDGMSLPVLLSHAGLNLTGMLCWIAFLISRSGVAAWLSLIFLVPAIGLGVSTVSVWTPYPVRGPEPEPDSHPRGGSADPLTPPPAGERDLASSAIPDEDLARALEDEAFASKLAEEMLIRNLAYEARTTDRTVRLDVRAIVPLAHGVLAIATFVLAVLAAVSAS